MVLELLATAANFLPLLVAVVALGLPTFAPVSERVDRIASRLALLVFGGYANRTGRNREAREQILRAAHVPTTYRVYAAKTLFYAAVIALAGSVIGVYVLAGFAATQSARTEQVVAAALPSTLSWLSALFDPLTLNLGEQFLLLLVSSGTVGVVSGMATYGLRWWLPAHFAANRRRRIEASMPRTISFVYALSRSGMTFPKIMRILARNRAVYGDAADEVGVAVREMELFGQDLLTAIKTMAQRTPSEQFREFSSNLASVLQSGQSLSNFLREQYERYREEAEAQQEQLLDLLGTLAEVYVTLFVAGPLFLMTILVILGIAIGGTMVILEAAAYLIIPLANLAFIIYLTTITESLRATRDRIEIEDPLGGIANVRRMTDEDPGIAALTDGGSATLANPNLERLELYRNYQGIRESITSPWRTLMSRPTALLYVTVPIAILATLLRLPAAFPALPFDAGIYASCFDIQVADDIVVQHVLFVTGTFAVVHEAYKHRVNNIEAVIPDFLDRLASINEAGMTIVESVGRVRQTDLGRLNKELDRIWVDIEWGADIESALYRFERRVQTTIVTRMVTLLNNAMSASGDLSPVLRIAAEQAKADRRLQRQRRQEMVTYLMVIYISFFVFLVIIIALNNVLIPALPDAPVQAPDSQGIPGAAGGIGGLSGIGQIDPGAYSLVFFHTALVQGALSGFIAGQMGGGNAKYGAKHSAILLALAYIAFLLL